MQVRRTPEFDRWLRGLRDRVGRAWIARRIDRLALGNPGDVKPVGAGISELRIDAGPGYRVYYCRRGDALVVLTGGDKGSQAADIARAQAFASALED